MAAINEHCTASATERLSSELGDPRTAAFGDAQSRAPLSGAPSVDRGNGSRAALLNHSSVCPGWTPTEMFCADCESCRDCTFAFLQHFLDVLIDMSLAFLQFCTSLTGIALGSLVLAVAAVSLFHN